jgi:hypothetical protein
MSIKEMLEDAIKQKAKHEHTFEELLARSFRKMLLDNQFTQVDWNKALRKAVSKWPERQQPMMRANLNARLTASKMTVATFKEGMAMFGISHACLSVDLTFHTDSSAGGQILQALAVSISSE